MESDRVEIESRRIRDVVQDIEKSRNIRVATSLVKFGLYSL